MLSEIGLSGSAKKFHATFWAVESDCLCFSIAYRFNVVCRFSVVRVFGVGSLLLDVSQQMASLNVLGDIAEACQSDTTTGIVADRIELVEGTCEKGLFLGATVRGWDWVPVAVRWLLSTTSSAVCPAVFLPASASASGISGSSTMFLFLLFTASLTGVVCMAFLDGSMGFVAIIAIQVQLQFDPLCNSVDGPPNSWFGIDCHHLVIPVKSRVAGVAINNPTITRAVAAVRWS